MRPWQTRARGALAGVVPLGNVVRQMADLASFVAGCYENDLARVGASCRDLVAEPYRKHLIPGFDDARSAARAAGAMAFSISGSGPAVFALCTDREATDVERAVAAAFTGEGLASQTWRSPVVPEGARVVEIL